MASGSELRLNLKALGVDGRAPDFGERLCQLSRDNEPYDFQFSAQGELIVMAPLRSSDSNLADETVINGDLGDVGSGQSLECALLANRRVPAAQRRAVHAGCGVDYAGTV